MASGWEAYLDHQYLMKSNIVSKAAIISKEGAICASRNLNLLPEEVKPLVELSSRKDAQGGAIKIEGTKCIVTRQDLVEDVKLIHLKPIGDIPNKCSVIISPSNTLVTVAFDLDGNQKGGMGDNLYKFTSYMQQMKY